MVMLRIRFLLISTLALNLVSSAKAATSSLPAATLPSPILVINNEPNFTYDELYSFSPSFGEISSIQQT
jgi:RNA recognition motif-containing protein